MRAGHIRQAGGETCNNEVATVSAVEHKRVRIADEQALIRELQAEPATKYLAMVPEHVELTPAFEEDVEKGYFTHDLVTVEESRSLAIRFDEADEHPARA